MGWLWIWTLAGRSMAVAGPVLMLVYPLYASIMAIESPDKEDEQQWLTYWVLYSFVTLLEMAVAPLVAWIPFYSTIKLAAAAWLVLPQFRGGVILYTWFVKPHLHLAAGSIGQEKEKSKYLEQEKSKSLEREKEKEKSKWLEREKRKSGELIGIGGRSSSSLAATDITTQSSLVGSNSAVENGPGGHYRSTSSWRPPAPSQLPPLKPPMPLKALTVVRPSSPNSPVGAESFESTEGSEGEDDNMLTNEGIYDDEIEDGDPKKSMVVDGEVNGGSELVDGLVRPQSPSAEKPVASMVRSHSIGGEIHGIHAPDPVAADILRKEPEQETFVRLNVTPIGSRCQTLGFLQSDW